MDKYGRSKDAQDFTREGSPRNLRTYILTADRREVVTTQKYYFFIVVGLSCEHCKWTDMASRVLGLNDLELALEVYRGIAAAAAAVVTG